MELENIILSKFVRFRRPKVACSPSYVDYSPKTNAAISSGSHQGEAAQGKDRAREGKQKLKGG
jgi:hypothetical protein